MRREERLFDVPRDRLSHRFGACGEAMQTWGDARIAMLAKADFSDEWLQFGPPYF